MFSLVSLASVIIFSLGCWLTYGDLDHTTLIGQFLIVFSGIAVGVILSESTWKQEGFKQGMKKASKQCQLSECPYIIQDSTQIYLENNE